MEAVRYTPGDHHEAHMAPDSRSWNYILLRGFDAGVTGIYRDGLGQPTFLPSTICEPYGLERVEVLRGPRQWSSARGCWRHRQSREQAARRSGSREIEISTAASSRKQLAFDLGDKMSSDSD